ncbi:MAG: ornithine cyclodeaminase [Bacteroides sp.]|nr:ornithine cyclodeaminase [Bacteroides sp.]
MHIITSQEMAKVSLDAAECVNWVHEAFLIKDRCQLPPKISLHPRGIDFFNTMPCMLPEEYHTFGCKVVSRIKGNQPALKSELMTFDTLTGEMTSLINADRITAMRTGAVAALAINTLRARDTKIYGFIGLGIIARATLDCLLATNRNASMTIKLKRYKDQAEKIISEYQKAYPNGNFVIVNTIEELISDSDVVVSCITEADGILVNDTTLFKPGVLVVPVHTRGFQNCDTIFDKVFADDEGHVKGFKYFSQFRKFGELGKILLGEIPGRESNLERILSYNVGIGLHDIFFAYKIINSLS